MEGAAARRWRDRRVALSTVLTLSGAAILVRLVACTPFSGSSTNDTPLDASTSEEGSAGEGGPSPEGAASSSSGSGACQVDGVDRDAPWPMAGGCSARLGRSPFSGPKTQPPLRWSYNGPSQESYAEPTIGGDGRIYIAVEDNGAGAYAIHQDGGVAWALDAGNTSSALLVTSDNTVLVASGNRTSGVLSVDRATGALGWRYAGANEHDAPLAMSAAGEVITGDIVGNMLSLNRGTSARNWLAQPPAQRGVHGIAIAPDGTIVFTRDGDVVALSANGSSKWSFKVSGTVVTEAVTINGDVAYVTSDDGFVRAFDIGPGKLKWSADMGKTIIVPRVAVAKDGTIYVPSDGRLVALGPADGKPIWEAPVSGTACEPIIDKDGAIFFTAWNTTDASLIALDAAGKLLWNVQYSMSTVQHCTGAPVIGADGKIYVMAGDAALSAYGP